MVYNSTKPHLSDATFKRFNKFLVKTCGILLPTKKKTSLEKKIYRRLTSLNLKTFEEYYSYLYSHDEKGVETNKLINAIVTRETYFFRNPSQLSIFNEWMLPHLASRYDVLNRKRLRIWSAACSTGEEPYTISVIMQENRFLFPSFTIDILGSDISDKAIKKAREGIYTKNSLRHMPTNLQLKYFETLEGKFNSLPILRKDITFRIINLLNQKTVNQIRNVDIIFCRNVLIYFPDHVKKVIVENLYKCLSPGGFLIIGHSESLQNISRVFNILTIKKNIIYQKE